MTASDIAALNPVRATGTRAIGSYADARVALWTMAAYLCLTFVPLLRAMATGAPRSLAVGHLVGLVVTIVAARAVARSPNWDSALAWLPVLAIPLLYVELPALMGGVGSSYHDVQVQRIELAMFGGTSPAATMAPAIARSVGATLTFVISELLHAGYLSFYVIIYAPLLVLAFRNQPRTFATAVSGLTAVFLLGFVAFILAPVQGPRYLWPAPSGVPDGVLRTMTLGLLERGSSRGTAFPSLHVAITVTQSLFALAWYRSLGVVLSFATVLLAVGAVYGGYHYVVDVLAGALLGLTAGSVLCLIHRTRSTSAE
jgi:membrane-associated phospholipid phosphatase